MGTPALVRLDDDDPTLPDYRRIVSGWSCVTAPRVPLSVVYNDCLRSMPGLDWYGVLADDVLPETQGWDRMLIQAAGRDGLAFGDDGINGPLHAAHFVIGGDLVRSVGFLSLPGLERIFIDTVWCDIARARGVFRYLPQVRMTHLHFSNRRALLDSTYRKPGRARDRAIYNAWKESNVSENPAR